MSESKIESVLRNLESMDGPGKDIEAAREELRDLRYEAYMSRCRGDTLAEINDQLRSEVDTRNVAIDHLEAENARLREALLSFTKAGCPCSDCTRARTALGGQ